MRTISVLTIAFLTVALSISRTTLAQDTKPEVYEKIHIPKKKPIPYPYTREADVMWSKIVWRMVDLREKINLALYYPLKPIGERMSLINLIFYGIDSEGLQAYDPDKDEDEFKVPMTKADLEVKMGNVAHKEQVADSTGATTEKEVPGERKYDEIKKILIKEKWFFDKSYSRMDVRILGICPIKLSKREIKGAANPDDDNAELVPTKICWIYYPEARNLFARSPIFNRSNDAQQASFDDIFMQRRFGGYIYAESNVYNNRRVADYTTGFETLLEADRIKESITNFEHDLWEY
jgi:gliding motility associated protien GldN